ncbi:hypothetical protein KY362_03530 [Candidatus Woesearchaeota archaeon]|nr:hypothetical protein [Candidatus Woesearchaeota archaeon]
MFIKDLQPRATKVDVEGEVMEVSDVREFSKFGKAGKVATAFIKDATGRVKLSLWNEQTEQVKAGDTVKVTNGYVNEFQGEMQLTTGKFGTLEVIPKEDKPEDSVTDDNEEEADALHGITQPHDDEDAVTEDSKLMADIDEGRKRPDSKPPARPDEEETGIDVEEEDMS